MSGSKTKTSSTTNQTQNQSQTLGSTPAANTALPGYTSAFQQSLNRGPYTGDVVASPFRLDNYVAGPGSASVSGIQGGVDQVNNMIPSITQGAQDLGDWWSSVARGDYMSGNPYLDDMISTMNVDADENLSRAFDMSRSAAVDAGAYGGTNYTRQNTWIAEQDQQARAARDAQLRYQNYSDEAARRERSGAGLQDALTTGLMPFSFLDQLGVRQSEMEQQRINEDIAQEAVRREIAQAGLTNDQARYANTNTYEMDLYEKYLRGLANPVFGENMTGQMHSQTDTTTKQSQSPLSSILGAVSAIGSLFGGGGLTIPGLASAGMSMFTPVSPSQGAPITSMAPLPMNFFNPWTRAGG